MSFRLAAALVLHLALPACASFASLRSNTYIEPGKAFLLGGGQSGSFSVRGKNVGRNAVVVYNELAGRRDSVTTLAPGAEIDAEFPARAMAVFRNTSKTGGAELSITVTGAISALGMRYEANVPAALPPQTR
jgi:hypothetical protein